MLAIVTHHAPPPLDAAEAFTEILGLRMGPLRLQLFSTSFQACMIRARGQKTLAMMSAGPGENSRDEAAI